MRLEIEYNRTFDAHFINNDSGAQVCELDKNIGLPMYREIVNRVNIHEELIDELKEIDRFFEINHPIMPVALRPVREAVKEMIKKATNKQGAA